MRRTSIAAIAAGAILTLGVGMSASALADDDDDDDGPYDTNMSFSPDTYADPATEWVPWASGIQNQATVPDTDTTVHCDGCAG